MGVFTLSLLGAAGTTLTTALLFCARAASMGAFAILYVYTPEARGRPQHAHMQQTTAAAKLRMHRAVQVFALLFNKLLIELLNARSNGRFPSLLPTAHGIPWDRLTIPRTAAAPRCGRHRSACRGLSALGPSIGSLH